MFWFHSQCIEQHWHQATDPKPPYGGQDRLGGGSLTRTFPSRIVLRILLPIPDSLPSPDFPLMSFPAYSLQLNLSIPCETTIHSHVCHQSPSPQRSEKPSRSSRLSRRRTPSPPAKAPNSKSSKGFNQSRQLATQHAFERTMPQLAGHKAPRISSTNLNQHDLESKLQRLIPWCATDVLGSSH